MMEAWVKPGSQCVCVNDQWDEDPLMLTNWLPANRVPMINEVLTIKQVITDHPFKEHIQGGVVLTFVEFEIDDCFALLHFKELAPAEPADPDNLDYGSVYDG